LPKVLRADNMNKCLGCFTCMLTCAAVNHNNHNLAKSSIKVKTRGGLQSKFAATICVACKEPACAEACPTNALVKRPGGGVRLIEEKCIACEKCVSACIVGSIHMDYDRKIPIVCKHCGACVRMCPHNCLSMEEVSE